MSKISTSLVINFGEAPVIPVDEISKDGFLSCSIDDRPDGLNGGKTVFVSGDTIGLLVYSSSNISNIVTTSSVGTMVLIGSGTRSIDEFLIFNDSQQENLSFPASSNFTSSWVGVSGGTVEVTNEKTVELIAVATVVLRTMYTASFLIFSLSGIPTMVGGLTRFPIAVVIQGDIA